MKIHPSAAAIVAVILFPCASHALSASQSFLDPVIVTASGIETSDVDATYASEVHTREDIERSGAVSLYDYLARHSSVQVLPSFGNRFTPKLDMRGYGIGDGYQNIVVSVNGRRLNSIDMVPQMIGAIPLADIERIEITKGSGSVMYGDGAMAGSIQIYTKARDGVSVDVYAGSHDAHGGAVSAGVVNERIELSAAVDRHKFGGFSDRDPSGHRDESTARNWRAGIAFKPIDSLKIGIDGGGAKIDTRYPSSLTLAQFRRNPGMNKGTNYTWQKLTSDHWSLRADYEVAPDWHVSIQRDEEDRHSEFVLSGWKTDSRHESDEISVRYFGEALSAVAGVQRFGGVRKGFAEKTYKENLGWFLQTQYELDRLMVSAGVRTERVEYRYRPNSGERLKDGDRMRSWDIGANYRLTNEVSIFGNYNSAFQTPDIDRFFSTDWGTGITTFNGFIHPARVKTATLGLNHTTAKHKLKVAVFHARLRNEIYLEPMTYVDTNIDKSHKYGVEIQESLQLSSRVTAALNYSWIRAIIDREDDGGGVYNGKDLPGVPRHSLVLGVNIKVADHGNLHLSHTWRSRTWAAGDFDNNNAQKQRAYQTTDLAYRHRVSSGLELYAAVGNVFDQKNGIWVRDDAIYPIDFERTWRVGARVAF